LRPAHNKEAATKEFAACCRAFAPRPDDAQGPSFLERSAHPGRAGSFAVLVSILEQRAAGKFEYSSDASGRPGDSVVTPTVKKSGGAYDQSAKPKYYIEFDGAGHFAWTNLNRTYVASINKYSVPFYDAYLKGRKDDLTKLLNAGRPKDVSDLRFAE